VPTILGSTGFASSIHRASWSSPSCQDLVLPAAYVGLEFCQISALRRRVTIVNRDPRLIVREDPTSRRGPKILEEDGIEIINSTQVTLSKRFGRACVWCSGLARIEEDLGQPPASALRSRSEFRQSQPRCAGVKTDESAYQGEHKARDQCCKYLRDRRRKGGPAFTTSLRDFPPA